MPGAISLVARRGKVVHFETYGSMDVERSKPMRPDTIFRIYSMTKPIASVALMMLYEEGRFQLDDPAAKFIPELEDLKVFVGGTADDYEYASRRATMTVRDLLMHTSGLVARVDAARRSASCTAAPGSPAPSSEGTLADMVGRLARCRCRPTPARAGSTASRPTWSATCAR